MILLVRTLLIALAVLTGLIASVHRARLYPNPGLVIAAISDGPDGALWLAAADGLYRFDGIHYHKVREFPFPAALSLAVTSDGALWIGGLDGLVRY